MSAGCVHEVFRYGGEAFKNSGEQGCRRNNNEHDEGGQGRDTQPECQDGEQTERGQRTGGGNGAHEQVATAAVGAVGGAVVPCPEAEGHDDECRADGGKGGDAQVFEQAHEDSAASLPVGAVHEVGEGSFYDVHGLCLPFGAAAVRNRSHLPGRKCPRQKDKEQVEDQCQQQAKDYASQDFRRDIAREPVGE